MLVCHSRTDSGEKLGERDILRVRNAGREREGGVRHASLSLRDRIAIACKTLYMEHVDSEQMKNRIED